MKTFKGKVTYPNFFKKSYVAPYSSAINDRVLRRIEIKILRSTTKDLQLTTIQKKGIQALSNDLKKQIQCCFEAENKVLYILLSKKKISYRTYVKQLVLCQA